MTRKKWITFVVMFIVAILLIGGFVWFIKDLTIAAGVYYLVTMIVSFACGWIGKTKFSNKIDNKELLKD